MRSFAVVEREATRQSDDQPGHGGVAVEVHVLALGVPPEPLHEDVVQGATLTVHADGHAGQRNPRLRRPVRTDKLVSNCRNEWST